MKIDRDQLFRDAMRRAHLKWAAPVEPELASYAALSITVPGSRKRRPLFPC